MGVSEEFGACDSTNVDAAIELLRECALAFSSPFTSGAEVNESSRGLFNSFSEGSGCSVLESSRVEVLFEISLINISVHN